MSKIVKSTKKSGMTTREKMIKRKEDLAKKNNAGNLNFIKEGVTRIRIKSPGDDQEIGIEIIQFYLGKDLGGIISPATFDEPCPFMEKYLKLKESKSSSDKELAGKLVPKRKYVIGGCQYKDEKGKEFDPDRIDKGFMVGRGVYQDITDLYLDEDEWGDMTDATEGYDIKINRSGSGMTDTTYTVTPCSKKPLDKKYRGTIDLEEIVRREIKSYEDLEGMLDDYIAGIKTDDDDDEDEKPKKSKKDSSKKKIKVKR